MALSPLFVYSAGEDDDIAVVLSIAWAEEALRLADRLDHASRQHTAVLLTLERMDYDVPPDENASFRELWVANHSFTWAVAQLVQWLRKAVEEAPPPDFASDMQVWRNSLEHLDEALIEGPYARADPGLTRPQSIRKLGEIFFGTEGNGAFPTFASTDDVRTWIRSLF